MKIGSLFDGSGGFPLAGVINGMDPVWASEIEPYPLKVTAARFPNMVQLGDVTKINVAEIEPVDVITFGSPCQDLSVAGKQAGIHAGERSNLFFEAIRIIKEMRERDRADGRADELCRPRFAVWENVPGAYSSNKGADFQSVLQALCAVRGNDVYVPMPEKGKWKKAGCIVGDGWSIAWRTYDAQYWGVPQRRKRIYLIADFASERAGEILFEREGVRGNIAASHEAWKKLTVHAAGGFDGSGALGANDYKEPQVAVIPINEQVITRHNKLGKGTGFGYGRENDPAYTLQANHPHGVVYDKQRIGVYGEKGVSSTLAARDYKDAADLVVEFGKQRKCIVRRLTPLECCRLQGFPDWWEDGVEGSDSARYKMWGNGIALPCAVNVLSRIANATQNT